MPHNQKLPRTPRSLRLPQPSSSSKLTTKPATTMPSLTTPRARSRMPRPATPPTRASMSPRTDESVASTPTRIPMSRSPAVSRPAHLSLSYSHALFTPSPKAPKPLAQSTATTSLGASFSPATPSPALAGVSPSPYMFPSIADPCIGNSLIHTLTCGHKVITAHPQTCASNCSRPLAPHLQSYTNTTITSDVFACPACVEEHVQLHLHAKRAVLSEMMHFASQKLAKLPGDYVKTKFRRGEAEWELEAQWERRELLEAGRECEYVAEGDPNYQAFFAGREPRSVAVPWPRKKVLMMSRKRAGMEKLEALLESDG